MSYVLIEQRDVHAARKDHKCIWCGEAILAGTSYIRERSVCNGNPQSFKWHQECLEAGNDLACDEGADFEFEPYANDRPRVESSAIQERAA